MDIDNNNNDNGDGDVDVDNDIDDIDDYNTKIEIISSMGFTYEMAQTALMENNYNVENAINYLLVLQSSAMDTSDSTMMENNNNDTLLGPTTTSASSSDRGHVEYNTNDGIITIHGSINQYSVNNGRSACTCIALVGGEKFLQAISAICTITPSTTTSTSTGNTVVVKDGEDSNNIVPGVVTVVVPGRSILEQIISCQFIDSIIVDGTHIYNQYLTNLQQNVEHTSVEDIMSLIPDIFPMLSSFYNNTNDTNSSQQQVQQIQGILSNDKYSPFNIRGQLNDIISNIHQQQRYTCVIMTKPPETILILLPPPQQLPAVEVTATRTTSSTITPEQQQLQLQQYYVLFDSHPRHNEFFATNAYCRLHSTFDDLCVSLDRIFPLTNLTTNGGDNNSNNDDMMSIMYNSFDLYVF